MPELIEVEAYRRAACRTVGRTIGSVPTLDALGVRAISPDELRTAVIGATITDAGRRGKLLVLQTDGPGIGLRFGMTGRLIVDGSAPIERLAYGGASDDASWDRTIIRFLDGGDLRVRDPRRLGSVELDPDLARLGPDAATIDGERLAEILDGARTALKTRLLDQRRLAGLGNLLVDESLWRAGLDPRRAAGSLDRSEVDALAACIVLTVAELGARGGSHTGDLQPARVPGASCPRDGAPLARTTVGGRTTFRCPVHQR